MKYPNAVLFHGKPSKEKFQDPHGPLQSKAHWFAWASEKLAERGNTTIAPILPRAYQPEYEEWSKVFDSRTIHEGTILIGRSAGAGLILRRMTERPELRAKKIILAAPWLDPNGEYGDLFDFEIDPDLLDRTEDGCTVFYSSNDDPQALASLETIKEALPTAKYRDIPKYGHYMLGNTMESEEFPELLEEVE